MINVTDAIKQAYSTSTTQCDKLVIDNIEYAISNVQYSDDCYSEGNIFGTAIARTLQFEIENNINLEGKEFEYLTGIKIGNNVEWISLGNFIIQEVEPNDTTNINTVNAMDYMLKTNTEYTSNLQYSNNNITLEQVLQEACTNAGLILATTDFPNKDFIVDSNQFEQGTLIRQVIQAVAQISGTVAKIKSDNKLYLINPNSITEVSKVFTLNNYAEAEIKRATHPINLVSLGMSDVEGENITLRDEESIEKDGENSLVINDNPFAYTQEKREQLITALFNAVKGFEYKAFLFECQGLPYLETMDKIQLKDRQGNTHNSYVFRFNYKSPNGLESSIEAPSIIKATVNYQNIPSTLDRLKRTELIVDKQNQTITGLVEETTENSEKLAQIELTVDGITQTVSSAETIAQDALDAVNGVIEDAITNVDVMYALSDSPTEAPTTGWSTEAPQWENGKYMWQKTVTTYGDETIKETEPTCISGAKGEKGDTGERGLQGLQGPQGEQGIPGPKGDSGEDGAQGPQGEKGDKGDKGDKGEDGADGINGKTSYFHIKYSAVENPTSSSQISETPNTYIGTYVDFNQTDSTDPSDYTWARFKGVQGEKGENGIPGTNGEDGKTSYLHIAYATNSTGTSGFSTTDSTNKTYIGQYTDFILADSNDPSKYNWTLIKGDRGEQGIPGQDGATGNGIKTITNYYLATSSGSNVTINTSGWTTTIQTITETKKYLWNYEKITYTDNSVTTTTPCIIGVYGNKGATGEKGDKGDAGDKGEQGEKGDTGAKGDTGNGIQSIQEYYQVSTSNSTAPTTWTTNVPTLTATNKYLWNYEKITYTDGTSKDTAKRVIGVYGDKGATGTTGAKGEQGEKGDTGIGVKEIEEQYYLSTSDTTQSGGSWKTTQDPWVPEKYIWTRNKITWTDNTVTYTTPVLAEGINNANSTANSAKDTADSVSNDLANNYYTKEETTASVNIKANEVTTSVTDSVTASFLTLLNNGYLTAEQVEALVEGNTEEITTIKSQLEQTITDEDMQIAISTALEGGVSYLKNTLFTINAEGLWIATSQDEFNAKYDNTGMYLYSYSEMIAKYTKDGAELKNLKVNGEIETGNLRIMDVVVDGEKRTHIHWIGG